jgi:hypothetical protein
MAFLVLLMAMTMAVACEATAMERQIKTEGGYLVFEGNVTRITTRTLVIDGKNFPISMFARVFQGSLRGQEIPLHVVVNVGKIDHAKLYVLRGKVEKIVVIKNDM